MYITITRQHLGTTFSQSSRDYVNYLEKENENKAPELQEHFFDQYNDRVSPELVIKEIDGNTAKLKKRDPKFYALTMCPSQRELQHIGNNPEKLRAYVREVMKEYAAAFYRDTPVTVDQIKYFAKIEYERRYKGFDKAVKENQPFLAKIAKLEHDLVKVKQGKLLGNVKEIQQELAQLYKDVPHKLNGQLIRQGMLKEGAQTHIHIIVSRRDQTNSISLSPGSSHKASTGILNGKPVKRGFSRDQFYKHAEQTFDRLFGYQRNYVERYSSRKLYKEQTSKYFAKLMRLPTNERRIALQLLRKTGVRIPNVPTTKVQLALKVLQKVKRAIAVSKSAGSIEI